MMKQWERERDYVTLNNAIDSDLADPFGDLVDQLDVLEEYEAWSDLAPWSWAELDEVQYDKLLEEGYSPLEAEQIINP